MSKMCSFCQKNRRKVYSTIRLNSGWLTIGSCVDCRATISELCEYIELYRDRDFDELLTSMPDKMQYGIEGQMLVKAPDVSQDEKQGVLMYVLPFTLRDSPFRFVYTISPFDEPEHFLKNAATYISYRHKKWKDTSILADVINRIIWASVDLKSEISLFNAMLVYSMESGDFFKVNPRMVREAVALNLRKEGETSKTPVRCQQCKSSSTCVLCHHCINCNYTEHYMCSCHLIYCRKCVIEHVNAKREGTKPPVIFCRQCGKVYCTSCIPDNSIALGWVDVIGEHYLFCPYCVVSIYDSPCVDKEKITFDFVAYKSAEGIL